MMKGQILLGLLLVCGMVGCQKEQPLCRTPNAYEVGQLKTGDLVFCAGQSMKSDMVRIASSQSAVFSHVGFVVRNGENVMMVHMSAIDGMSAQMIYFMWKD